MNSEELKEEVRRVVVRHPELEGLTAKMVFQELLAAGIIDDVTVTERAVQSCLRVLADQGILERVYVETAHYGSANRYRAIENKPRKLCKNGIEFSVTQLMEVR